MQDQLSLWAQPEPQPIGRAEVLFAIRESRRARQLILQALPPRTVELVVPVGMRAQAVRQFIHEHRSWIDRAGAELLASYPEAGLKPAAIELKAIRARIDVRYRQAKGQRARFRQLGAELRLYGAWDAPDDSSALLRRWLLEQGRHWLRPWLMREAARTGLAPQKIQVRLQQTRWGSCSATGSISINAALLLVPPELVRYLFVHELCHLMHLSHSSRFWRAVARHEPDFRELDRRLALCWRELPAWLFAAARGHGP